MNIIVLGYLNNPSCSRKYIGTCIHTPVNPIVTSIAVWFAAIRGFSGVYCYVAIRVASIGWFVVVKVTGQAICTVERRAQHNAATCHRGRGDGRQ
jgi:hypothetical protein